MSSRHYALLFLLAALFGAAFPFIRLTAPVFGPFALVELRIALAAGLLLLYAALYRQRLRFDNPWRDWLALGFFNVAAPFVLIATAQLHITASLTAMLVSTIPMFTAVVAALWTKEALTPKRVLGLALGLGGVAILTGWSPLPLDAMTVAAAAMVLAAALCYGVGNVYTKRRFGQAPLLSLVVGNFLAAGLLLLPFALAAPPPASPTGRDVLLLLGLTLLSTVFGYLLFFRLLSILGPTITATVAYLVPVFGTFFSWLFLGEPVNLAMLLGLAVVLTSIGLVTDLPLRWRRQVPPY